MFSAKFNPPKVELKCSQDQYNAWHLNDDEFKARVMRVVGNSLAYLKLPTGRDIAVSSNEIIGYRGERFADLGLVQGALINITVSANEAPQHCILVRTG